MITHTAMLIIDSFHQLTVDKTMALPLRTYYALTPAEGVRKQNGKTLSHLTFLECIRLTVNSAKKFKIKFQIEWEFVRCTPTNISKSKTQKIWHKNSENNLPLEQVSVELNRYSWRRSHLCGPKRSLEVRRTQSNKRKMLQKPYHAYWRVLVCVWLEMLSCAVLSVVTPKKIYRCVPKVRCIRYSRSRLVDRIVRALSCICCCCVRLLFFVWNSKFIYSTTEHSQSI